MTDEEMKFARGRLSYWSRRVREMQAFCSHEKLVKRPFTIEGYAEKTQYKLNCHCPSCDKRWTEDQ